MLLLFVPFLCCHLIQVVADVDVLVAVVLIVIDVVVVIVVGTVVGCC